LGQPAQVGRIPAGAIVYGLAGGENRKVSRAELGPNEFVGSGGAATCISVLIVTPTDIVAVHLYSGNDSPARTLDALGPYPPGSRLVIAGGTNRDPQDFQFTQFQIAEIESYAKRQNLIIDGFYDSSNIYVNANGDYFDHERRD
jgi:hypothetical protein